MRLTVRTLLAYLDNVLPEESARQLEAKLNESAYATLLADRIKATVKRADLAAPAVDAKHPIEDPNAIAEYLDNVLAGEHVPEIERVLLDSEMHMAEAAACHQILSIVLSQPATVAGSLRDKIVAMQSSLPATTSTGAAATGAPPTGAPPAGTGQTGSPVAGAPPTGAPPAAGISAAVSATAAALSGESVSSLELPPPDSPGGIAMGAANTGGEMDAAAMAATAQPFRAGSPPSGQRAASSAASQEPAIAGVTRRKPDVPDYLRVGQRSLALPALLTLGLCAALLFIIVKAFSPMTRLTESDLGAHRMESQRPILETDADLLSEPITADPVTSETTPAPSTQPTTGNTAQSTENANPATQNTSSTDGTASLDAASSSTSSSAVPNEGAVTSDASMPTASATPAQPGGNPASGLAQPNESGSPSVSGAVVADPSDPKDMNPSNPLVPTGDAATAGAATATAGANVPAMTGSAAGSPAGLGTGQPGPDGVQPDGSGLSQIPLPPVPGVIPPEVGEGPDAMVAAVPSVGTTPDPALDKPAPAAVKAGPVVGKLTSEGTLLINQSLRKALTLDGPIHANVVYVNLPTFRSELTLSNGVTITLIHAAECSFTAGQSGPVINLMRGHCLLKSTASGTQVSVNLGHRKCELVFADADAVAALTATTYRAAGADPERPENIQPVIAVHAVDGQIGLSVETDPQVQLTQSVRWSQLGDQKPQSDLPESIAWVRTPDSSLLSVDTIARKGLLEQIKLDAPIDQSLRAAIEFHRPEVAALAGRSLLVLGESQFYFTSKGLLSNERQKSHWGEHLLALQSHLDGSPEQAAQLRVAAKQNNPANGDEIYRMLWGYSPDQLADGSDFDLVESLDNSDLAIRVLAIETLRQITGETYSYRAYDAAIRRAAAKKKWDIRYDKQAVRWSSPRQPLSVLAL